ncbi:receptor-like protein kinase FERONIA [Neltuma alba]|uniref:receptor-like protein kinase FERONIA n=1 Tax=Neltuma alba TaxID=207710 RepID=UPI0010A49DF3|nr:receptor-like protein kinase FERONIA [Prosopis alba]
MVIAFACAALGVIIALSVIGFLVCRRRTRDSGDATAEKSLDLCRNFSITEISAATDNFDGNSIIGQGGFGMVYKGHINNGKTSTPVAIKRLKAESEQGADEFETEIKMLSQFRHPHLVDLIGYCKDDKEMILVYEFMARGTLRDHLNEPANQPLSWKQRLEICIEAANALLYLHTNTGENKRSVIHRDVKSANILLDENWKAKVSDFGLSRIGPNGLSRSHVTTLVKGSVGYIDPQYCESQQLTTKSDVYSFGVVLLEALCGKPHIFRNEEKQQVTLVEWFKKCYEKGEIGDVVDPFLKGVITPQCLNKFVQIALACLRDNGKLRPPMRDVVRGLGSALKMQGSMEVEILREGGEANKEDKPTVTQFRKDEESGVQFSTSSGSTTTVSTWRSKVTVASSEEE